MKNSDRSHRVDRMDNASITSFQILYIEVRRYHTFLAALLDVLRSLVQ